MRWSVVKCIMLACIATTTLATEKARPKRDLQFWKELIAAKLNLIVPKPVQKEEHVKIVHIPNIEHVVVRAPPKITFIEAPTPNKIIQVQPPTTMIGSYFDTRSPGETLFASQGIKQLIQNDRQEFIQISPPKPPVYVFSSPIIQQRVDYSEPQPLYPVFKETVFPAHSPVYTQMPVVQSLPVQLPSVPELPAQPPRVITVPPKIVIPEIRPVQMAPAVSVHAPTEIRTTIFPTKFSYKQRYPSGSIMSYLSNEEVIVTETRKPPPPPPTFIIDRLQKIVYGEPLGNFVPIISEPSVVDVRVNHTDNKITETSSGSRPTTIDVPVVISPPHIIVEAPKKEDADQDRYKHVHADGTVSTYTANVSTREPYDIITYEHVSRLPPPPPELLKRIENIAGKAHKPKAWGWGLKMSNGVGSYGSLDEGKIYYSHLESDNSDVLPDPLSSLTDDDQKRPNSNVYYTANEDIGIDEFGRPFLSTKIKGEGNSTGERDFGTIKKFPPLPMPIAGENHQPSHFSTDNFNQNKDYHGFGSDGYSYTQVNHDGTVDTFTNTGKITRPVIVVEGVKKIPTLPVPVVHVQQPAVKSPVVTEVAEGHGNGFSYTQINRGGTKTITEVGRVTASVSVPEAVSLQPVTVVDVLHHLPKAPCKHKICKKLPSEQINHGGKLTEITENSPVRGPAIVDVLKVPQAPVAILDVVQPIPKPQPIVVEDPSSSFSYTQVNKDGLVTNFVGNKHPMIPADNEVIKTPVAPKAVIDVIQPIPKPVTVEVPSPNFSYTQVNNGESIMFTGNNPAKTSTIFEAIKVPKAPAAIVDVIQDVSKPKPAVIEVGTKYSHGAVTFGKPVLSSYVYKQISHTNPQPFTVVHVGEAPTIDASGSDVHVSTNGHIGAYSNVPCTEFPKVVPDAPIPPVPSEKAVPTISADLIYVPPLDAYAPNPTAHKVKVDERYSQITPSSISTDGPSTDTKVSEVLPELNEGQPKFNEELPRTKDEIPQTNENLPEINQVLSTTTEESQPQTSSNDEPISFDLKPIVVASENSEYFNTQENTDGSLLNSDDDSSNTISVTAGDSETNTLELTRGDLADAIS